MSKSHMYATIGFLVLAIGFISYRSLAPAPASLEIIALAQCLSDKGATMYGAEWCSHCQAEKARFGDASTFVPYVECPQEPDKCLAAGIEGYPTWIFADGRKLVGEQGLEKLAQVSGCQFGTSSR